MIRVALIGAGGRGTEITPEAAEDIAEAASGIPRQVNKLCDFCLVYAAAGDRLRVTHDIVAEVLNDGIFFSTSESNSEAAQ